MQKKNNVYFNFVMKDAWGIPISRVVIPKENPNTVYFETDKEVSYGLWSEEYSSMRSVKISEKAIKQIRELLDDERLYKLEQLESRPDIVFTDGFHYNITFADDKQCVQLQGDNIMACKGEYESCPSTAYIIDLLEKIARVLVTEGVDRDCFIEE